MTGGDRVPLVVVVVVLATLVGLPVQTGPADAAGDAPRVAVLGDSYASGEGLLDAAGDCARSDGAWGVRVAEALGATDVTNAACTGAAVADLWAPARDGGPPQVAALSEPADVVLLLVAGNDIGFTDLVADCLDLDTFDPAALAPTDRTADSATPGARPSASTRGATPSASTPGVGGVAETAEQGAAPDRGAPTGGAVTGGSRWQDRVASGRATAGCDTPPQEVAARVDEFGDDTAFPLPDGRTGRLADVHRAVAEATLIEGGTLVVASYPALTAPPQQWAARYGRRCFGVLAEDAAAVTSLTTRLGDRIAAEAAVAARMLDGRADVVFADVRSAADGHGLCGPGEPWLNGVTLRPGGLDTAAAAALLGEGQVDVAALGLRPAASFHPAEAGHEGITTVVLDALVRAGGEA